MRWDRLFDDLESQLDHEQRAEERAIELDGERLRIGRLGLRDRLAAMSAEGGPRAAVRLELVGGRVVQVRPAAFGRDWLSGHLGAPGAPDETGLEPGTHASTSAPPQCVIPLSAIAAVLPGRRQLEASLAPQPESAARLAERIGLAFVLRDLARRRLGVEVTTTDGRHHGTIDRVARDHLDLAVHETGVPRRERDVHGYRMVPFERVLLVTFR
ncbi:hypothetical protein BCL57_002428 [Agromyces flavus]|uniref:Uncharacterized protein n=1 Tax=Agromyces flavus TaxID=589382 RepID=A0A1H1UC04_9MICO|nr:hypothetical protein [Agromyces flavus]MCP2368255.1 hypothetical protein [Agromyces flavus]GGI47715.1 hypothetical protein GCM10010932_24030 [Agromyces flavus]SDS69469.1 hypothetical protein SAMN04489721_1747 [Agromyces flavus]